VIVGELQSGSVGLGYLIQYGSQVFKLNIVMAAVSVLALLSVLLYALIYVLETIVSRRRRSPAPGVRAPRRRPTPSSGRR
jgi:NitT/TauT family transport system permease protein